MSDPVVEELLEKGARAVSPHAWDDDNGWSPDTYADVQGHARAIAGLVADAMFPGWREGITREWGTQLLTKDGSGVAGSVLRAASDADALAEKAKSEAQPFNLNVALVSRWLGPWVPVEEGTDG